MPDAFDENLLAAWNGQLDFSQLIGVASTLEQKGQAPLAAVLYQTWTRRTTSPYLHAAYFNLGVTLSNLADLKGAEGAYREAIRLQPLFLQPRLNLGSLLERQRQFESALNEWRWIEQNAPLSVPENKPLIIMAINHLGRVLEGMKQLYEAHYYFSRSLSIDPTQGDVLHHWVSLRQKLCLWPVHKKLPGVSTELMWASTSALSMLSISDDPAMQLEAARGYAQRKVISGVAPLAKKSGYHHKKIRIAYCSSDFCLHPVSMLTVELFELHNRESFEVYGYCWSPEDGSELRQRVIAAMDHFIRINELSDEQAAQRIRADEIDILIDLQGQTSGARPNMLAYRPAPVQITYLGLPATTGLPSIDYVIADKFLIPETATSYYSEKPLYLPYVFQVSDSQRKIGPVPSRSECGLPETGTVFCSFNNSYKITPEIFDIWSRILQQVPGSVLWLLADNQWAQDNLRIEAGARRIEPERLIFAGRVLPEDYLARYAVADLFLDCFPFNAGTTANDALWTGLPILTCAGRSFASRMAGALLTAADLPELITDNLRDYEKKATELGLDSNKIKKIKAHLGHVRTHGRLFDIERIVNHLEYSLQEILVNMSKKLPFGSNQACSI